MKFFDRTREISMLRQTRSRAEKSAQFTVVTGRRRVGKTSLILKAYEDDTLLYFFVARKAENELCEAYMAEISQKLGIPTLGQTGSFADIFGYLMKLSVERPFTLFIDEFQEFFRVNKSIYSDMQRIWDMYHADSHINLIVCGSIYSTMTKIFRDQKEPLYGRQTQQMTLRPFKPSTLKEILAEHAPQHTPEDLLALYSFTGGVAKYVQLLMDSGATSKDLMVKEIIKADSIFLTEGKAMMIEEFGRDYGTYFSILTAIARGKTSRAEIEAVIGREIGGYLTNLENDYEIIAKTQPVFEKTSSKNVRYHIKDNFLLFWFRFIYKYNYILEIEGFEQVRQIIERDYETFSGLMLEKYFREILAETGNFTRIGGWWDRKGENEIDIVAENELTDNLSFYEIKRKAANIDIDLLKRKADAFFKVCGNFPGYSISYRGLSMEDM